MTSCEIKLKWSDHEITVRGEKPKEVIEAASQFDEFPTKCSCGSTDLRFCVRHSKTDAGEYTYYELVCRTCGRAFSLGETKSGARLFPKWKEGWQTREERMNSGGRPGMGAPAEPAYSAPRRTVATTAAAAASLPPEEEDDVPF
jgi:hypothetical protein